MLYVHSSLSQKATYSDSAFKGVVYIGISNANRIIEQLLNIVLRHYYYYYFYYKILYSWCIYIAFYTNVYQIFTILQKKGDAI